ncbi:MAG: hypothetical protein FJ087_18895 [Deltaproteobacteria bacterium]|nr:hypothetical protein [Deltaproteobacteria bacterium]
MARILRIALVVIGVALLITPEVWAQKAGAKPAAAAPAAGAKKGATDVRELNFDGDVVEAEFLRPQQGVTEAVVRRKKSSLIHTRTDFVDEILKSAEDL